jgi:transcriptional regulator with XRE-family HTH domain
VSEELAQQPVTSGESAIDAAGLGAAASGQAPPTPAHGQAGPIPAVATVSTGTTTPAPRVTPHLLVGAARFAPTNVDLTPSSAAVLTSGVAVVAPRVATTTVSVAMDFARLGGWAGPLVFNTWLRRQIRERRMSQRQLGALSGVDHSTISRLLRGDRTPSLETATKLVHALRMEWTDEQVATYFDLLPERTLFPIQRVESALRGDLELDDDDVKAIMDHYLKRRVGRRREASTVTAETAEASPPSRAGPAVAREHAPPAPRPIAVSRAQVGGTSRTARSARGLGTEPAIGIDAGVTGTPARPSSSS